MQGDQFQARNLSEVIRWRCGGTRFARRQAVEKNCESAGLAVDGSGRETRDVIQLNGAKWQRRRELLGLTGTRDRREAHRRHFGESGQSVARQREPLRLHRHVHEAPVELAAAVTPRDALIADARAEQ